MAERSTIRARCDELCEGQDVVDKAGGSGEESILAQWAAFLRARGQEEVASLLDMMDLAPAPCPTLVAENARPERRKKGSVSLRSGEQSSQARPRTPLHLYLQFLLHLGVLFGVAGFEDHPDRGLPGEDFLDDFAPHG